MRSVWRAVTVVGAGAVLLAACGGPAEMSVLEAAEEGSDEAAAEESDGAAAEEADAGAGEEQDADAAQDEVGTDGDPEDPTGLDDPGTLDPDDDPGPDDVAAAAEDADAAAVPDADLVAAPCAAHEDRELEAFLVLVAPVDGQVVGDEVEIVGCSNVYEATVNWRLLDGDGGQLDEGFTTAACGTGCVGAFRETVSLAAAAGEPSVRLQTFWISPQDGTEEDLQERTIVLD